MKKTLFLGVLLGLLFVTGCGVKDIISGGKDEKRVTCSQKVQTVDVNMIADYTNDELSYLGLKYNMDLSAYSDIQINAVKNQDMCSVVKTNMSTFSTAFENCKQTVENKVLVITADFNLSKIVTSDNKSQTTKEEMISSLEKQGYSCVTTDK